MDGVITLDCGMTIRQPSSNQGPNRSAKSTFCSNSSKMSISLEAGYHKNGDIQPSYACPTSRSSAQMLGKGNQRPALTKRTSSRLQRNAGQLHTGWLPLLPLNEPSLNTESGRHLTRPGRDGEPLQLNKARFKDLRAVGAFLVSTPVALESRFQTDHFFCSCLLAGFRVARIRSWHVLGNAHDISRLSYLGCATLFSHLHRMEPIMPPSTSRRG